MAEVNWYSDTILGRHRLNARSDAEAIAEVEAMKTSKSEEKRWQGKNARAIYRIEMHTVKEMTNGKSVQPNAGPSCNRNAKGVDLQ